MLHPSNDIIMNAQQFFAADQSEANLVKLLHAVSIVLQEGAEVLIPTAGRAAEGTAAAADADYGQRLGIYDCFQQQRGLRAGRVLQCYKPPFGQLL